MTVTFHVDPRKGLCYIEDVEITWLGHSCFKIKGGETTLITDPFSPETGYNLGNQEAQIVTVSHDRPGHNNAAAIAGTPKVLRGPGEYEIGGVLILGVATFHDAVNGVEKGKNTVFLYEIDDITICHMGDIGHLMTPEQLEEIDEIDVLMIPMGGVTTLGAVQAAEQARKLEPKIVIPMHYATPGHDTHLEPVDKFLAEFGARDVEPLNKLSITRNNLPDTTKVVLLNY
jgi:L-ascorbate metabolism protein UlaG (beta-lactamase superfamily)